MSLPRRSIKNLHMILSLLLFPLLQQWHDPAKGCIFSLGPTWRRHGGYLQLACNQHVKTQETNFRGCKTQTFGSCCYWSITWWNLTNMGLITPGGTFLTDAILEDLGYLPPKWCSSKGKIIQQSLEVGDDYLLSSLCGVSCNSWFLMQCWEPVST